MSAINLLKLLIRDDDFLEFVFCFSSELLLSILYKFLSVSHQIDYLVLCNTQMNYISDYFSQFNEVEIMRQCLLMMTVINRFVKEPRLMYEIIKKERKK
jgi:hypothetical protein